MGPTMKKNLKNIVDLFCSVLNLPLLVLFYMGGFLNRKDQVFWSLSQALSLIPGGMGNFLRKNFYRWTMTRCDEECAILFGTLFSQADTEVGKGVYIGPNCNIGRCKIENYCTIGSGVHIMSGKNQHEYSDLETPIQEQAGALEKIVIGEDTWVGNCAVIMARVGKKCIVGAGAIVTKSVEDFSIVAGNPARLIKKRK